jgi:hypothetical protein
MTSVGPYAEYQVVVLDDANPTDAGWITSGWFQEIINYRIIVLTPEQEEAFLAEYGRRLDALAADNHLPEPLKPKRRGRPQRRE